MSAGGSSSRRRPGTPRRRAPRRDQARGESTGRSAPSRDAGKNRHHGVSGAGLAVGADFEIGALAIADLALKSGVNEPAAPA